MTVVHFISTTPEFKYMHMIAVLSAIANQNATKICMWVEKEPTGIYWQRVKPLVKICPFEVPEFAALHNKSAEFVAAHVKDYLTWTILYTCGGLILDLDTISVKDSTHWAEEMPSQLIVSLDVEDPNSIPFPYNSSVVMSAKSLLDIAHSLKYFTTSLMNQEMTWGLSGPILLSILASQNDDIVSPGHTVFCPFGGHEINRIYEDDAELQLPENTEIIHLYAKSSDKFNNITSDFIRNSDSLFARTIRAALPESDWDISDWNEQEYLHSRGRHYAGLFRIIRCHNPVKILEIGTSSGDTAIGMIRTCRKPETGNIIYWGVDLFEKGTNEVWQEEFTGGYIPPSANDVQNRLKRETDAEIHLMASNSNDLTPTDFALMNGAPDLIYIDGGHSVATTKHDWLLAKELMGPNTVIVFDDYFTEMPFIGSKSVVDAIDRSEFTVHLQPELDTYTHSFGRLITGLAVVFKKSVDLTDKVDSVSAPYHEWADKIMKEVRSND